MKTNISIYFAFSTGIMLLVASIYKIMKDNKNFRGYLIPLFISLIILGYGVYKVNL